MSGSSSVLSHHDHPRYHWWFLLIGSLTAAVLGVIGFWQYDYNPAMPLWRNWVAAIYDTLQLFALHTQHFDKPISLWLDLARVLAAIVALWTIGGALWRIYAAELHHFRLGFLREHVVICGAGWRGLALARDFAGGKGGRRFKPVVVIEKDPQAPGIRACEEMGLPVLVADAADRRALKAARANRARVLVATCTADGLNLEIAVRARELIEDEQRGSPHPLKCYVQLSNPDLRSLARSRNLIAGAGGQIDLATVGLDIYENSARGLFARYELDRLPILADSLRRAHLLIVGCGEMGENVLMQAARIGQFANGRRLRITVVDGQAPARERALLNRVPAVREVVDISFQTMEANDPAIVELAGQSAAQANEILTVVLALPDDPGNLALAFKLLPVSSAQSEGFPIRVRMSSRSGMAALLIEERQRELFGDRVRPFGMLEDVCNREELERPQADNLARAVHAGYFEHERARQQPGQPAEFNPALVPWEELPEEIKNSNRQVADHIEIKLRALGYHSAEKNAALETVGEFSPAQIEVLARMEHLRFCAERLLAGWRYAPGKKNLLAKTNPTLVPWEKLGDEDREKDRSQVILIPRFLDLAQRVICR